MQKDSDPKNECLEEEEIKAQEEPAEKPDLEKYSLQELLQSAQEYFEKSEMDDANMYYEEAVKRDPDNDEVLSSYGIFLSENDEEEKATFVLERAIKLHPNTNYKKYLYLAQLKEGKESLQIYEVALNLMKQVQGDQTKAEELKKDMAETYAAMAEIYQTDLINFKESDNLCISCINQALQIDPNSLDATMQLSNYYLNKELTEKAVEPIKKLVADLTSIIGNQELDHYTEDFKLQAIKLSIEIEDFGGPIKLLESLRLADENNIEALYLLSFCNFKLQNYYSALELLEELQKKDLSADEEIKTATLELQDELNKQDFNLAKDKADNASNPPQGEEEDDNWMDIEHEK